MLDYIVKAQRGQAHGIAGPERRTPLQLLELLESSQIVSGDEHARRLATLRTQLKR
jgi:hypothetical protein